jgi:hypothetical protein
MMSREWIKHLHVRLSEIERVSGDDDEIVNERGRCDQTVLIGIDSPDLRGSARSFAHRRPVSASHGTQTILAPSSNQVSSRRRRFPAGDKSRIMGSTAIARSLFRNHFMALELGAGLVASLRTLASTR